MLRTECQLTASQPARLIFCRMEQCLVFCRTNFDCDNLEAFFNALGGGQAWRGLKESGKENPYSCVVLAGARSTGERREALQVGHCPAARTAQTLPTVQLLAACGTSA